MENPAICGISRGNSEFRDYNFGSLAAAEERWRAAQQAGVDYIASDQYELLAALLRQHRPAPAQTKP